jgi:hypothetical protein
MEWCLVPWGRTFFRQGSPSAVAHAPDVLTRQEIDMRTCMFQPSLRVRGFQALGARSGGRRMLEAALYCGALLTLPGCVVDGADAAVARPAFPMEIAAGQPAAHELHRMFEAEKKNAAQAELPAQF